MTRQTDRQVWSWFLLRLPNLMVQAKKSHRQRNNYYVFSNLLICYKMILSITMQLAALLPVMQGYRWKKTPKKFVTGCKRRQLLFSPQISWMGAKQQTQLVTFLVCLASFLKKKENSYQFFLHFFTQRFYKAYAIYLINHNRFKFIDYLYSYILFSLA